jgi:hypothetical protein
VVPMVTGLLLAAAPLLPPPPVLFFADPHAASPMTARAAVLKPRTIFVF